MSEIALAVLALVIILIVVTMAGGPPSSADHAGLHFSPDDDGETDDELELVG
jgi:hypothetical protein